MIWSKSWLEILTDIIFISNKEYNSEDTTFSGIFDRQGRFEIGL